jgi:hypothetical protein
MNKWKIITLLSCALVSVGWALWCWHDPIGYGSSMFGTAGSRWPTPADHASLMVFAVARVLAVWALLLNLNDK